MIFECMRLKLKLPSDKYVQSAKNQRCCDWPESTFASGAPTKCLFLVAEEKEFSKHASTSASVFSTG